MTTDKKQASRARTGRGRRNNNPASQNQYDRVIGIAQSNPIATAAAVGGALATGIFLWSRRNQLSGQITNLTEQVNEWRERRGSDQGSNAATSAGVGEERSTSNTHEGQRSQVEISREALALKEAGTTA